MRRPAKSAPPDRARYPYRITFLREDPFRTASVRDLAKRLLAADWVVVRGPGHSINLFISVRRDFRTALMALEVGGPQIRRVEWEDCTTGRTGRIRSSPQPPTTPGGVFG